MKEKKTKKKWRRTDLGYWPIKIVLWPSLVGNNLYCNRKASWLGKLYLKAALYCDTVGWKVGLAGKLYCNRGSVLQLRSVVGWELY